MRRNRGVVATLLALGLVFDSRVGSGLELMRGNITLVRGNTRYQKQPWRLQLVIGDGVETGGNELGRMALLSEGFLGSVRWMCICGL